MLSTTIRKRLDRLTELPAVPFVISELLNSLEDQNIKAKSIASLIERDQTLTARVLRVANSPFYGFVRKISTIELAVVLLGLNTIKEIVVSLILQRLFTKAKPGLLEIHLFWQYSVFCGTCSRMLARRMGYRLAGEAFVAGLMHDIGILIINEYFSKQMLEIKKLQGLKNISLTDAEKIVLDNTTHCDIGAWFAEKWNLPDQLCDAIRFHHSTFYDVAAIKEQEKSGKPMKNNGAGIEQPLTVIVAISEWFAAEMGFMKWVNNEVQPTLYLANEVLDELKEDDYLHPDSALEVFKSEIADEFEKASVFHELPGWAMY